MNKAIFNKILVNFSAIACGLSFIVFIYFLSVSESRIANANNPIFNSDQILLEVNNERIQKMIRPLTYNPELTKAAQEKAADMARKSYFSHISPVDGKKWSDFIKDSGYKYIEAGENLANGFNDPKEATVAWMNSPSHRDNILNEGVDETGVGIAVGTLDGQETIFIAQVFGKKE